jgi:hypothetical protein
MPSITNKAYDYLLIVIDQLMAGMRKHSGNAKLISSIQQSEIESMRSELEALRQDYLNKEKQARLAYLEFQARFKSAQQQISNDIRITKGIIGPKSQTLLDFGIMPERPKHSKNPPIIA